MAKNLIAPKILLNDRSFVVVSKPPEWVVYASQTEMRDQGLMSLQKWTEQKTKQKVFPVHRLDRPTSGLVVFGKTPKATANLTQAFSKHKTIKTYLAILVGAVESVEFKWNQALKANKSNNLEPAVTEGRVLDRWIQISTGTPLTLVALQPKTGRYHQLRKHASLARAAILGDQTYGPKKSPLVTKTKLNRLYLHAWKLELPHPTRPETLAIEDPTRYLDFGPGHFKLDLDFKRDTSERV